MTEEEWLVATVPQVVLNAYRSAETDDEPARVISPCVTERKLRHFAIACSRRAKAYLRDPRSHNAINAAELFADGNLTMVENERLREEAHAVGKGVGSPDPDWPQPGVMSRSEWESMQAAMLSLLPYQSVDDGVWAATMVSRFAIDAVRFATVEEAGTPKPMREFLVRATEATELGVRADLLRCILGNPFRPVAVEPHWLTSTVVTLAEGIYAERAFDRMPILADALEDAGCDNAEVLNHCRGDGPHVRGCWVVDLLTGRK